MLRYLYGDTPTHRRFTAYRILDDVVYAADVRPCMVALMHGGDDVPLCCEEITRRINEGAHILFPEIAKKYEIGDLYLPWQRLFEIGFKVKEI